MAEGGYPFPYVVDCHASWPPPVPPRQRQGRRRAPVAQTLLFLLLSVALCGMAIEACIIYRLHHSESDNSASSSKLIAGDDTSPTKRPRAELLPSKPVAHLTDGRDVSHGKHIMAWSNDAEPLLHEIERNNTSLLIKKEGFYYVYSKISFLDTDAFHHSVELKTQRYPGKSITLLASREYSQRSSNIRSNSYLGGVFHLHIDDALFVKVSDTSKILRYKSFENIFGAYMI